MVGQQVKQGVTPVIEGNARERGIHIDPGAIARRAAGLHGPGDGDR